jgi:hypothetical protein
MTIRKEYRLTDQRLAYDPNIISVSEQDPIQTIYEDDQLVTIAEMSGHGSENLGYEQKMTPRKHQGKRGQDRLWSIPLCRQLSRYKIW